MKLVKDRSRRVARPPKPAERQRFYVVAAGGGAGSLNAFTQILARLPKEPGAAFLFMTLAERQPRHDLAGFLANASVLPVVEVKDRSSLEPNKIYVPIKERILTVSPDGATVQARTSSELGNTGFPLDAMFQSVAAAAQECSIGVLLSGKGSDGVIGLNKIKGESGIVFVQSAESAAETELVIKATLAGVVDAADSPRVIAEEILRVVRQRLSLEEEGESISEREQSFYTQIFTLLRALTGVDFSYYKQTTLRRRIQRRMLLKKLPSLEAYVRDLQVHPAEADALFHDILINVTSFFRDAAVFQTLSKRIFPKFVAEKGRQNPIRVWVPGCSTGEEVYSLVIALIEFLGSSHPGVEIQFFGTDISEPALNKARAGVYPESITAHVSADRLRRFFQKIPGVGYQISKHIRDLCVFAKQNLFEDPPFSRLDLISCRNVLIYLGPHLQKKVIPVFHYALKPNGYLLLGNSETIGLFGDLFALVEKKSKIYQRRTVLQRPEVGFTARAREEEPPAPVLPQVHRLAAAEQNPGADLARQVDRILLAHFAPTGVVVNSRLDVLQFRGQTRHFVEHSPGEASLNLLKIVRPPLAMELRTLVSRALKLDVVARKQGLVYHDGRQERVTQIDVIPFNLPAFKEQFLLILFTEVGSPPGAEKSGDGKPAKKKVAGRAEREINRMQEELLATKESLQAIIEEQEATNEELKSANEEIQSSNEELQSTNEELETAKEELQSTNEELTTLNEELQNRNGELTQTNNDMNNLLSSVNLPILMLGNDLTIRRFTPMAERFFNIIPTDVGRRISDINTSLVLPDLAGKVAEVIDTLKTQEHEVQTKGGHWYSLRIRPYRTTDNKIDGAVLVLVDINEFKNALEEVTEMVSQPLIILTGDYRVLRANHAFYNAFQVSREETENQSIYSIQKNAWKIPALKALLEGVLPEKKCVEHFEIEHQFPGLGHQRMAVNARILHQENKGTQLIVLAIEAAGPEGNEKARS